MKTLFKVLVVSLVSLVIQGCVTTEYAYFSGPRVTENYPAGESHYQPLPPIRTQTWHAGSETHGRVEYEDDGGYNQRHGHQHNRESQTEKTVVIQERSVTKTVVIHESQQRRGR